MGGAEAGGVLAGGSGCGRAGGEEGKEQNRRPVVNQIEVHPFNTNTEIATFCRKNGIQIKAYAPLLADGICSTAQECEEERIEANKNVEGIDISEEDMKRLGGLDEVLVMAWNPTNAL
ncbi:hypothetical protein EV426DRAFT_707704 [Tirmania nivea]|nr:hypothetical protein EV426DRAFT_707704 [Tirmania nivea]